MAASAGDQCRSGLDAQRGGTAGDARAKMGAHYQHGFLCGEIGWADGWHGLFSIETAIVGLTFAIARETAGEGITVNAIAPAYVMSPMISEQLTQEQRDTQPEQIPVGRFCEPEEVAHTVAFLISPLARFITGEVIDMNGGLHFD